MLSSFNMGFDGKVIVAFKSIKRKSIKVVIGILFAAEHTYTIIPLM